MYKRFCEQNMLLLIALYRVYNVCVVILIFRLCNAGKRAAALIILLLF